MASRSEDFKTGVVRLAFSDGLFELQTKQSGGKQWACSLLIPKGDSLAVYEKAAMEAATAEWGEKAKQLFKDKLIHNPFLDGDGPQGKSKKTGDSHAGFPGNTFLRVNSGEAYRPTLIDRQKLPIADRAKLKSGDYGYAVIHCYTWENTEKGKGLTFGISMFQLVKEGESLGGAGGGVDIDKWAETIPDEGKAPESTRSGAGAGGLFG